MNYVSNGEAFRSKLLDRGWEERYFRVTELTVTGQFRRKNLHLTFRVVSDYKLERCEAGFSSGTCESEIHIRVE
jgi:hypothetical protein